MVVFDLDDTLAPSKSPLPARMSKALGRLLEYADVCIISGGAFEQFEAQVLDHLEVPSKKLANLHLMPTCGTKYYRYDDGEWQTVYSNDMSDDERSDAIASLTENAQKLGFWEENPWGDIIEDRGTQITFSALGQEAPLEAKRAWDPDGSKKEALREEVAKDLDSLSVRSGGSTSIDITKPGVDKAYGLSRLSEYTGVEMEDIIFIGDRLDEGGNDFPVIALGCKTVAVDDWEDTASFLEKLLTVFEDQN